MSRGVFASLLALLCMLSVGYKFASWRSMADPDLDRLNRQIGEALEWQEFKVRAEQRNFLRPYLVGRKGSCRLAVGALLKPGAEEAAFFLSQNGSGRILYFHDGAWLASPPRMGPLLQGYAQRLASAAGLTVPSAPLIAVHWGPGCRGEIPFLAHLRQYPQNAN